MEYAARKRPLGADLSQCAVPDCATGMGLLARGRPAALARTGDYITDSVLPIFKTGQADLIGDEHMLASDIALEPAPGHTPGLTLVRLGGGRDEAILCSDLMHHPLQVRYPNGARAFARTRSGATDAYRILQETR